MKGILLILLSCVILSLYGEDALSDIKQEEKSDSIYVAKMKEYVEQGRNEPLSGKKYGVEINFLRLMAWNAFNSFSGTFSLFDIDRTAEVAFPVYYCDLKTFDDHFLKTGANLTQFYVDAQYRKFLGVHQHGFYVDGFSRYNLLIGNEYVPDPYERDYDNVGKVVAENRIAIGVGIGYRIFSYQGLYWGTNLNVGRYLIGEKKKFCYGSSSDDKDIFFDVDFFKFGYAF